MEEGWLVSGVSDVQEGKVLKVVLSIKFIWDVIYYPASIQDRLSKFTLKIN